MPQVLKKLDVFDDGVINAAVSQTDSDADRYIRDVLETQYGDATLDQMVGPSDLTELKLSWLQTGVGWANGNFDGVGDVGPADLSLLKLHWLFDGTGGGQGLP